eukprot:4537398-Prymnesium_polylepis.1
MTGRKRNPPTAPGGVAHTPKSPGPPASRAVAPKRSDPFCPLFTRAPTPTQICIPTEPCLLAPAGGPSTITVLGKSSPLQLYSGGAGSRVRGGVVI